MSTLTVPAIRVLVADENHRYRRRLRDMSRAQGGFEIVAEAENGTEAIAMASRLGPDVVMMDIKLPPADGVWATSHIVKAQPATRVIMLTIDPGERSLIEALKAGAQGYLLKDVDALILIQAIQAVYRGQALLDPGLTARLFDAFRSLAAAQTAEDR